MHLICDIFSDAFEVTEMTIPPSVLKLYFRAAFYLDFLRAAGRRKKASEI